MGHMSAAPPLTRREKRVVETRRALVAAARQMFERDGYNDTTIEQIAAAADVAPRTLFRYFPTKAALLFADFDAACQEMLSILRSRPVEESPLVSLRVALRWLATYIQANPDDTVWGFRLSAEQGVHDAPERYLMREQTDRGVAEFLAERWELDIEADPRPTATATATMGVFVTALRTALQDPSGAVSAADLFESLLVDTASTLVEVVSPGRRAATD